MYISSNDKDWYLRDIYNRYGKFRDTCARYLSSFFELYLSNGNAFDSLSDSFKVYFLDASKRLTSEKTRKIALQQRKTNHK